MKSSPNKVESGTVQSSHDRTSQRLTNGIMLAVLVWGIVLSIGAALYGVHPRTGQITYAPNPLRGGVLLGCVLVFLGFWRVMLRVRARS